MKRPTFALIAVVSFVISPIPGAQAGCSEATLHPEPPLILFAQAPEEGDIDESYDSYGPDVDEEIEYDDALMSPADTSSEKAAPKVLAASIDSMIAGIKWFGHASFLIENDENIYVDPFEMPKGCPPADIILITHEHSDHFSPKDIDKLAAKATVIVSVAEVKKKLSKGLGQIKVVEPGDTIKVKGIGLEAVPAYNVKKRFHPKEKGHVGFVIHLADRTIYHAGDTDFIPEMEHIKADIVLLPIGGTYTMDAAEAAKAANVIKPAVAIPMHWGKIVGSDIDVKAFKDSCDVPVVVLSPVKEKAGSEGQ